MSLRGALTAGLGCVLLGALVAWFGPAQIATTILASGWTAVLVSIYRFFPLWLDAIAWRFLFPPEAAPGGLRLWRDRWIGESVNTLLPVAQIGGDVVRARLAAKALRTRQRTRDDAPSVGEDPGPEDESASEAQPGPGAIAGATVAVDFTFGLLSQLLFTLVGLLLLVLLIGTDGISAWLVGGGVGFACGLVLFGLLLRGGGIGRIADWLQRRIPVAGMAGVAESTRMLGVALGRSLRRGRGLAVCLVLKCLAWFARVVETFLIMRAIGIPVGFGEAVIIEAIGSAARSMGFAVPGAVGIQEGGFVAAAALLGQPPEAALALALVKRARELMTSLPGLVVWAVAERDSIGWLLDRTKRDR